MKIRSVLVSAVAGLLLSMGTASAAEYTMRLSHQFPPAHHTAINLEQFAKEVAQETDGAVEVQIFGAAQLFKPAQHHAAVAGGEIESAVILSLQWGSTIPLMSVSIIPYLMSAPEKQQGFLKSDAAKLLDQKMLERGVRNIAWLVDANDLLITSSARLLDSPEKFDGVKIRGLNRMFDYGLEAMGAVPVTMPGSEVYQALQTGVVDAGITGVPAAYARKFYEVQSYGAASAGLLVFDNLVVNPAWWDGLPEDVRAGIERAADAAVQRSLILHDGVAPEDLAKLVDAGMEAVALTPEQVEAMKNAMQPAVREQFLKVTGDEGQKLIDLIEGL